MKSPTLEALQFVDSQDDHWPPATLAGVDTPPGDEHGFPVPSSTLAWDLYIDEFDVLYICVFVEALGEWGWVYLGRRGDR